jgi:hypothetical protein
MITSRGKHVCLFIVFPDRFCHDNLMYGTAALVALSMILLVPLMVVMLARLQGGQSASEPYISAPQAAPVAAPRVYRQRAATRVVHRGGQRVRRHPAWGPR